MSSSGQQPVAYDIDNAEVRRILEAAIAAQQPFFTALLNQVAAIDSRQGRSADEVMKLHDIVHLLINANLVEQIRELKAYVVKLELDFDEESDLKDRRILALEFAQSNRTALMKALDWAPKMLGYLVLLVGAIMAWLEIRKI